MFQERDYHSRYFAGAEEARLWERTVGASREKYLEKKRERRNENEQAASAAQPRRRVTFVETEEQAPAPVKAAVTPQERTAPTEAAVTVQEHVAQPQPAAAVQSASEVEQALTDLLGRFSYDAILREIQRSVQTEVERVASLHPGFVPAAEAESVPAPAAEPAPIAEPVPAPEPVSAAQAAPASEQPPIGQAAHADEERAQAARQTAWPAPEEREAPLADAEQAAEQPSEDEELDIVSLLQSSTGEISVPSPIEMMEVYDEKVLNITFEELAEYNQKRLKEYGK